MFVHNINPVIAKLGIFEIRYYGLAYVIGFLIAYFMIQYLTRKRAVKLREEGAAELIFYLMIGVLLGARMFYVLVYDTPYYLSHLSEIFAVWHGGMSFHGGLIGAAVSGYLFCRKYEYEFYDIADIMVIPLALALGIGRIANFINGELYGHVTNVWWAVKFPSAEGYRHPSQIYEAVKNFFIFGMLWFLRDKKLKKGTLFWLFVLMYGILRFFVEFFREGEIYYLGLSMGQYLCIIMAIVSGIFLYLIYSKKHTVKIPSH